MRLAAALTSEPARAQWFCCFHFTALRIGDVAMLARDRVSWDAGSERWRMFLRTEKTGAPVFLPIPDALKQVLGAVPSRPPVPAHARDGVAWPWCDLRRRGRHPGELANYCPEALRKVVTCPPEADRQPHGVHRHGHNLGTNEKGRRISMKRRPVIWCGEGDLNPHE